MRYTYSILAVFLFPLFSLGGYVNAQTLRGKVIDSQSGNPLVGATVLLENTTIGTFTNEQGEFSIRPIDPCPCQLMATFLGYDTLKIEVESYQKAYTLRLFPAGMEMDEVTISARANSALQDKLSLTVESLNLKAIENATEASFYDALANLREVDLLTVSFGFKVVNTRGFNSSSPIRSLQLIDGVDNSSPGLNFPVGNFLGLSELDVEGVDLVVGSSSAYFGPGAFNGVLNMRSKSPFLHRGLDVVVKGGERSYFETVLRYAQVLDAKNERPQWAFKINGSYSWVDDWPANDYSIASTVLDDSVNINFPIDETNAGGYDAVNIYGDEGNGNDTNEFGQYRTPGLGRYYRTGYREDELVDYGSYNVKAAAALHFRPSEKLEIIASSNFGIGTTVMQLDNRLKLNDVWLIQNKFEIKEDGRFFLRGYHTEENTGNTFDIVATASELQILGDDLWVREYENYWLRNITNKVRALPGFPASTSIINYDFSLAQQIIEQNPDSLRLWHQLTREAVDVKLRRFNPGSPEFQERIDQITSTPTTEGGTRYIDASKLFHLQGEYRIPLIFLDELVVGGNYRHYLPDSEGTIFSDTANNKIEVWEWGAYVGAEKKFHGDKGKINLAVRFDKNKNFDLLVSPAISAEYNLSPRHSVRALVSSALRNPTLIEQFFYFRAGNVQLLGNTEGYNNLVTLESFNAYRYSPFLDSSLWERFNTPAIVPEQNFTGEIGYQGLLAQDKLAIGATYYLSRYKNFIGYLVALDVPFFTPVLSPGVLRISANSEEIVYTTGASLTSSYQINRWLAFKGNYSWNRIIVDSDDPLIPAYNTPEHKFNLGLSADNMKLFNSLGWNWGINFRWISTYRFDSSPQFSGQIPEQAYLNAQIGKDLPKLKSSIKIAGSNLLNRNQNGLFGAPGIGRFVYAAWRFSLK